MAEEGQSEALKEEEQTEAPNQAEQTEALTEEQADALTEEQAAEPKEAEPKLPPNKVTIEGAGPCKNKVTIEIPEETIQHATDKQYETLRKEALVPGFRKGQALAGCWRRGSAKRRQSRSN